MAMKAARQLARKRWADKSEEERAAHAKMMGEARQAKLTPAQRSAAARKAAAARWAKARQEAPQRA